MNRDDIIRMAEEAGLGECLITDESADGEGGVWFCDENYINQIERFFRAAYAAGAAAERENMIKDGWRRCAVGQKTTQFCGMLEDAVKAERDAAAKALKKYGGHFPMCSANVMLTSMPPQRQPCDCGLDAEIRARGEK